MGPAVLVYAWNADLPLGLGWLWLVAAILSLVIGRGMGALYDPESSA